MKTFMLCTKDGDAVAFHKEKRIIQKFKMDYEISNNTELDLFVIKGKNINKYPDYSDLYLVKYGESYVQTKYFYIANIEYGQIIYDYNYAKDVLNHIIEFTKDNKKEKHLMKAVEIIEGELRNIQSNISSIELLDELDNEYQTYQNKLDDK